MKTSMSHATWWYVFCMLFFVTKIRRDDGTYHQQWMAEVISQFFYLSSEQNPGLFVDYMGIIISHYDYDPSWRNQHNGMSCQGSTVPLLESFIESRRLMSVSLVLDDRNVFHLRFSSMARIQISRSWRHGLGKSQVVLCILNYFPWK